MLGLEKKLAHEKHMKVMKENHRAICSGSIGCRVAGARELKKGIAGERLPPQGTHTNAHRRQTASRAWSSTCSCKTMALLQ